MSYINKSIGADERLVASAKIHWVALVYPTILLILGVATLQFYVGYFFLFAASFQLLGAIVHRTTTDLAVTNKKLIAKWGLFRRQTIEQRIGKIDTIQVDQGIMGRLLNYGSITVTGSGFAPTPIKTIADPLAFRRAVELAEDAVPA